MTVPNKFPQYTMGSGWQPNTPIIYLAAAPTSSQVNYPAGQVAIVESTNSVYQLTSFASSNGSTTATWTLLGAGAGNLNTLTTDDLTVVTPSAGNINLSGTGSITTVGAGHTATVELTGLTNHSVLVGAGTATVTKLTVGTNGQVLLGSTGADPAFGTLTTTTGVAFTTGAGSLAVDVKTGGFAANSTTGTSASGAVQNSYVCSNAAQTSVLLPATAAVGSMMLVAGTDANTGGIKITQAAGQTIRQTTNASTTGAAGTVSTAAANTSMLLLCVVANTDWLIIASEGTLTFA